MFYWVSSILTHLYTLLIDKWDAHVHSLAFDRECKAHFKCLSSSPRSSRSSNSSEHIRFWEDDDSSSMTSTKFSYKVTKLKRHLYYFGLCGNRHSSPKLVFRMSMDVFTPPTGPENNPHVMQLLGIHKHKKLSQANLWATICEKVCDLEV